MMTAAVWCVLIAGLLPYVGTGLAKSNLKLRTNAAPREWLEKQEGWRKRAHWYQLNSFEAFPLFAAAVLTAQQRHAVQARIDHLAIAFILFRVLHLAFYLTNIHKLRTLVWFGAIVSAVWIFVVPGVE
jgi:uncharacterized MAPEG superfamily protein